jgi:hypothetical protein
MASDKKFYAQVDGLNVRLATANDYQVVMDIDDNVYFGFDYLPSMYYQFMHSKRDFMFVLEEAQKIVSTPSPKLQLRQLNITNNSSSGVHLDQVIL